jgi:hypothetical protein
MIYSKLHRDMIHTSMIPVIFTGLFCIFAWKLGLEKIETGFVGLLMTPSDSKSTQLPSESQLNKAYGKGFNMLKKMGFKAGTGLGPTGEGILAPIEISMRRPGEGLRDNEGVGEKRPKSKRPRKKLPADRTDEEGSIDDEDEFSEGGSSDSSSQSQVTETWSREDREVLEARKALQPLQEQRRVIEYKLFALEEGKESHGSTESLVTLSSELVESNVLQEALDDLDLLDKLLDLFRDKFEGNPFWYELDVELFLASLVSEAVSRSTEKSEITPELILQVRNMILDDEHFGRLLEFQLLPPLALAPNLELFRAIKTAASQLHFQSIYERFLKDSFSKSTPQVEWLSLIPSGKPQEDFLLDLVKPRLVTGSTPEEVLVWKPHFSSDEWKDIIVRICNQIQLSLKRIDSASPHCLELIQAAVAWADVVSPCVVGFLLVESGFLPRWFEINKTRPDLAKICSKWLPVFARVAYHSPARKIVTDSLRVSRGEEAMISASRRRPGGPPAEFFASQVQQEPSHRLGLGDVIRQEASNRHILVAPKPGIRQQGCQVFKVGQRTVYWKDESLFEKPGDSDWREIGIDSLFS